MKLMLTFGPTSSTDGNELLVPFFNGLLDEVATDAAFSQAQIIDGYEQGYYILNPEDYQHAYDRMRQPGNLAYQRIDRDQVWAERGAAAFGIYTNNYSPEDSRIQAISAMDATDESGFSPMDPFFYRTTGLHQAPWGSMSPKPMSTFKLSWT